MTPPVYRLLVYPVTNNDLDTPSYRENAAAKPLDKPMMQWFFAHYVGNQPATGVSPFAFPLKAADLSNLPPAAVITAQIDPLRSEGKAYADKLEKAGVKVTYAHFDGVTHEFFGTGGVPDAAMKAVAHAADGLKAASKK